ncbi:ribulose-1,5-biphosphate synthetase [Limihaloglobus sulfuriphilus]|uniref:Ribulose-1,5-biphosphate synthetase n=1 Tax=Limihaloglobus sulfuriphilus TaxID=1851148 RepID=A0A1Q2MAM4_9BACT|nr:FAD-dependent oxidoreductase [Limihaloglobus sulfuriphilus]AQQ69709.1 ribulose-1,5-biphosphate synthetase [Limihaloglobus sulfuriphilus]
MQKTMPKLWKFNQVSTALVVLCVLAAVSVLTADTLTTSEREFSKAYDVDVLVVGGSSAGVAAAAEAADSGSDVFLMALRPYLGEDVSGTYRMWLKDGEEPQTELAQKVFQSPEIAQFKNLPFKYSTDTPSASPHKDYNPPRRLNDEKWVDVYNDTVQYNENVNIVADLGEVQQIERIKLHSFQRPNDYCTLYVTVFVSNDKENWEKVGVQKDIEYIKRLMSFSLPVNRQARYIKFYAQMAPQVSRQLISEIEILTAAKMEKQDGKQFPPTRLHIKRTLDTALLDAGVEFLYDCYPTDVLFGDDGSVRGVIMANRAGRQAVMAKKIIDATGTGLIARLANAQFRNNTKGENNFEYTVVANKTAPAAKTQPKEKPTKIYHKGEMYTAFEYEMSLKMDDESMDSFARVEQEVLDHLWTPGVLATSETAFYVPAASVIGEKRQQGGWNKDIKITPEAFKVRGVKGLFMLNGYADISREFARQMLRPVNYMYVGEIIGRLAAEEASSVKADEKVTINSKKSGKEITGQIKETLAPVRPSLRPDEHIRAGSASYPVIGRYDVVVVGGGTSGAPAAIGAARNGGKTLVIEHQHGLGGVGTLGYIGRYWRGHIAGFTKEMDQGILELRPEEAGGINGWDVYEKMEWYRRQLREAGADIWTRCIGWGAVVNDKNVKGVAVATPYGCGIVLADVVIDSTGNGDIAIAAGADYECLRTSRLAIQGTGLPPFDLGDHYNNSDFTITYESDVLDAWHLKVYGKSEYRTGDSYDIASLIDTRERRRVIGDYFMTVNDQLMQRIFPDSIVKSFSDYDCHGVNFCDYLFLQPNPEHTACYTPYRSLLPKGLSGILLTGMGISVHHDALPLIRMQPDLQNQGYAAGTAAAMAAKQGIEPRDIDIKQLQKHLVQIGNIPEEVLSEKDVYPFPAQRIRQAVENAPAEYGEHKGHECGIILAHPNTSVPMLKDAFNTAEVRAKLFYAHALAVLEDPYGLDYLVDHVNSKPWDVGHTRPTSRMSDMDRLIIAISRPGDRKATPAVVKKIEGLDSSSAFTHFRSVAIAMDRLKDPAAAKALAELLQKPEMSGYVVKTIEDAQKIDKIAMSRLGVAARTSFSFYARMLAVREISIARALYRCGDYNGIGEKILREYCQDLRGVQAAHAAAILEEGN